MRRQDQKRKEEQKRQQWEQEQVRIYTENRNRYNRAYAACLEGKNYTVPRTASSSSGWETSTATATWMPQTS